MAKRSAQERPFACTNASPPRKSVLVTAHTYPQSGSNNDRSQLFLPIEAGTYSRFATSHSAPGKGDKQVRQWNHGRRHTLAQCYFTSAGRCVPDLGRVRCGGDGTQGYDLEPCCAVAHSA